MKAPGCHVTLNFLSLIGFQNSLFLCFLILNYLERIEIVCLPAYEFINQGDCPVDEHISKRF